MYRSEHPKPQFMRKNWMNLNGQWQFEFDFSNSGKEKEYYRNDKVYKKQAYLPMLSNVRVGDNVEIKYLEQQNNKPIIIKSKIGLFIKILLLLFIFLLISLILYAIIVTLFSGE